jgi:hypothetical protein
VSRVQALLGEQAVAVVLQTAAQARGELFLGELAQGDALQAHGGAAVDANADDLVEVGDERRCFSSLCLHLSVAAASLIFKERCKSWLSQLSREHASEPITSSRTRGWAAVEQFP